MIDYFMVYCALSFKTFAKLIKRSNKKYAAATFKIL